MIVIKDVSKAFGDTKVLEGINSVIPKGSIYALIGTNGAGKSTLLNMIDGIYRCDGGCIEIDGEDIFENTGKKAKIAYIPDDPFYFNGYSMNEMADFMKTAYPGFSQEKYEAIVNNFPLDTKKPISSFSKGMKRQAAIIFALAQNPEILLCDECFDGLDPVIKKLVKRLIINEVSEREMTAVISSHNLREMENLCDIVGILNGSRIVVEKSMDGIKDSLHKFQLAFKPMIEKSEFNNLGIDIIKTEIRGGIMEIVARGNGEVIKEVLSKLEPVFIESINLSLEDIFIYETEANGYDFSEILL
ncbi:MAG: ABC transporter ATP-binding protein [Clostridia bacterium]|nr:ABC transporter ATP-binding protein [Clostridia bacterium]